MQELLKVKLDNKLFLNNGIDDKLFNYKRDLWNSCEFEIIEKMIDSGIIKVENYELCKYGNIDIGGANINDFKAYYNEKDDVALEKTKVFYYLSQKYNILLEQENSLFYIPELNLYLNHRNQTVLEFIKLCSIKNANIGVISSCLSESDEFLLTIRIIKVKSVFNLIYNDNSIFTPKTKKTRNSVPIIELKKHFKERNYLVRAYIRYREQMENELRLHNQRSMIMNIKPIKYSELDIDIVCQRFLNDIINKKNLNK